ncbi:MAG: hypothetical protein Ta2E_09750 [Mycoplasmoidaceae bacterium]|nr:MAG: hypothetical protein Ta2E_09750 [Mycoplasmoidaceae bacterium]
MFFSVGKVLGKALQWKEQINEFLKITSKEELQKLRKEDREFWSSKRETIEEKHIEIENSSNFDDPKPISESQTVDLFTNIWWRNIFLFFTKKEKITLEIWKCVQKLHSIANVFTEQMMIIEKDGSGSSSDVWGAKDLINYQLKEIHN